MDAWIDQREKPRIYLKPGELCVSRRPVVVTTVLGSCVSATFFHQASGMAAICHALQPRCTQGDACMDACSLRYRYAVCAIQAMTRQMNSRGIRPREIEVKLFGGAALIGSSRPEAAATSMGRQNVTAAMETISDCGLFLKVMDVGGSFGRKIIFDTATGEVLMKRLRRTDAAGPSA
ncbi:MAG: chemotaxis protein CheD [Desulfobacterales bacterium]|nr:chemotaxis protein CheD [Desulfobacterales bacterium]